MASNEDLLASIDAQLNALLILILDDYLRRTDVAKPKARSIDRMLSDAGLTAQQIGTLLGKTDRAVHLQLQRGEASKSKKPTKKNKDGSKA